MRIAIFSDNFYPELSGVSDSIIALTKQLARRGHFVDFYVPWYPESAYAAANVSSKEIDLGPNVHVNRLFSFPFATGTGHGRFVIPIGLRALEVSGFHPDVIHTQFFFGIGLEAIFAGNVLKKPVIGTNHTALKEFLKYSPIHAEWSDRAIFNYMNWYYEQCALVTAPSKSVFDEMEELGFKNPHTRVLSNPIDTHTFRPLPNAHDLKKKFDFTDTTIIHAGRLSDERSPEVLVKALPIVREKCADAMLAFAGKGTSEEKLRALATKLGVGDAVKFLGFVDKPTLNEAYNASEVFAIASTGDTQSLVMMQAMASGIPIVGVRARALPEYINDDNGFVVEPNDERAMAEKIVRILEDRELGKKLGEGARKYAETFSEESIADRWVEIYEGAIKDYNEKHTTSA